MSRQESGSFSKYLVGVVFGVAMTYAYVRFGFSLPGVVQLGDKVASEAFVSTAEFDLYNRQAEPQVRQRALAVVLGQRPELLIEIDNELDNRILHEVTRRKAVRKAKLIRQQEKACAKALEQPALRDRLVKKHGVDESEALIRRMLLAEIENDDFLHGWLLEHFPDRQGDKLVDLVMSVYQHELRETTRVALEVGSDPR